MIRVDCLALSREAEVCREEVGRRAGEVGGSRREDRREVGRETDRQAEVGREKVRQEVVGARRGTTLHCSAIRDRDNIPLCKELGGSVVYMVSQEGVSQGRLRQEGLIQEAFDHEGAS